MVDKLVKSFITLIVFALSATLVWRSIPVDRLLPACMRPISYSLGTFDPRFGLSQKDFLKALGEAEEVWESALRGERGWANKDLFDYNAESDRLTINLIYDYRQEVTNELTHIEGDVKEGEAEYRRMEQEYRAKKAEYERLRTSYDARLQAYEAHEALYNQRVDEWNAGQHNSTAEFQALERDREALEREFAVLKSEEAVVNSKVKNLNTTIDNLNKKAKELNLDVAEYNTIGASRGDTFAGGLYTSDRNGERIDIFEFSTHEKLVRVLAHELGHALGLEHVDDPQAIMYKFNEGKEGKLTKTDIAALKTLCRIN